LKPRRNELRTAAPADWLAVTGYDGSWYDPVFRDGVPDGLRDRWRAIREFVERWNDLPMPDVGGRPDEIRATESRLGQVLPPSVREWVAFAHDIRQTKGHHVVLRDVYQMSALPGHPAISLLLQAEGDYHWAVREADLGHPDPPVHGYHWDYENDDETRFVPSETNPTASTVTEFVLGYVSSYLRETGGSFGADISDPEGLTRDLVAAFPVRTRYGVTDVYEGDGVLAFLNHWAGRTYLTVNVRRPIPRDHIPAFLWAQTRQGGWSSGMFISENNRRQIEAQMRGTGNEGRPAEDIPF